MSDHDEVLDAQFVWLSQPEDGAKTRHIHPARMPVDTRKYFLRSPQMLGPAVLQVQGADSLQRMQADEI